MSIPPRPFLCSAFLAIGFALSAGCSKEAPVAKKDDTALLKDGKELASAGFALLSQNLIAAMAKGGVPEALKFCHANALPLTSEISVKHGVTVQRLSHKARNPANRAEGREGDVLGIFDQQILSGQPAAPRIERDEQGRAVFYSPILLPMDTCLKCHGEPGKDISAADLALIRSLYPEDAATGFKLGQLRGMWKITFNPQPPKP